MKKAEQFDIAVVGAGAVGIVAALTFAREGYKTCLIGPQSITPDGRTVALFQGSISFLDALGLWEALRKVATPLQAMRIIDDTGNLFHIPSTLFKASEINLDAFGWNISNTSLVENLSKAVSEFSDITCFSEFVCDYNVEKNTAVLTTESGKQIYASLLIAADGRRSSLRKKAGISTKTWDYPQAALTTILSHTGEHNNISTEFHTRQGPFTLVPLPGRLSILVGLAAPERAHQLMKLSDAELAQEVQKQAHHMLGRMQVTGPRASVMMSGLEVNSYVAPRLSLVGETAHAFPPIGAQGLNLGLRDVANLRDVIVESTHADIGHEDILQLYNKQRANDVTLRNCAVDSINRMLLSHHVTADLLRASGMFAIDSISPLRKMVMRIGMRPLLSSPQLMRNDIHI